MSQTILLIGAGKIGRMIASLLIKSGDYQLRIADRVPAALERIQQRIPTAETRVLNADSHAELVHMMQGCTAVISALSFRENPGVARAALEAGVNYFDLTEDRQTTAAVKEIADDATTGQVFVPQCGLAPGFVTIVSKHVMEWFDEIDTVRMRVGALPQHPTNALGYNLTWSTDGLINEYCNPCEVIHGHKIKNQLPLEGLEQFTLDGNVYEAFNTSGGLGTLCETMDGHVRELNYKTIRYPGHHQLMKFLLQDLRLADRRELLKDVMEHSIPVTFQDVVIVFCTVRGNRNGQFVEKSDLRKLYAQEINGEVWSAIQLTTGAGICAVVDLVQQNQIKRTGLIRQEEIPFDSFINNRFGCYYETETFALD
ncbi:saccharopine dehydrogenase C-terminal domain-containing protein [uncultured Gimesia sp.]|uniref:saccharopine dehydrogenase family protein n=1 Tax=uncultured Gimesia sp. TaxID=1678688 RepID=UPI0030DD6C70|tara:strand:- start:72109 stop:73215 length:1107 start_codon:yes stop_codon:yes gene_type:complete